MKSLFTLIALTLFISTAHAATTRKSAVNVDPAPADTTTTYSASNTLSAINWDAGLGLGSSGSEFQFGVVLNGLYPVTSIAEGDLLLGGQTGFLFGPGTVTTWTIPVMAQGQFNFKGNGKITPYAGLGMGISIEHASTGSTVTDNGLILNVPSQSATAVDFAIMAKGGLYFGEAQKYFAELPLGSLGGAFAIFPSVGMKF